MMGSGGARVRLTLMVLVALAGLCSGCLQDFLPESSEPGPTDAGAATATAEPEVRTDAGASPAGGFPGEAPRPVEPPGPSGPFIEPPLVGRPQELYWVITAAGPAPAALTAARDALAGQAAVPIGYPAVDQAPAGQGFVLVAGKFARKAWAQALADALRAGGLQGARVMTLAYRFDRHKPAANTGAGPKAGRVFAGMAGMEVPLLAAPGKQAEGTGRSLADGALIEVLSAHWVGNRQWLEVRSGGTTGYLAAGRVLTDANLFPAPDGKRAVLGVGLGCYQGTCRWDYWLVGRGYTQRKLLKSAGQRMPHAFSPDGRWLAYTTFDPSILVAELDGARTLELGPGISPSFSADGKWLYLRGPGVHDARDDVRRSLVAAWADPKAKPLVTTLFDLKGTPIYPKAISTVPPQVDTLPTGELFTLFYRVGEKKDGSKQIQRWGVRFSPEGKLLEKAGVAISD